MMVKAGNAHPEIARDILNFKRLVDVLAEPFDRPRDAASVPFGDQQVAEPRSLFSP
jgi:hypothetical protein